MEDAIMKKTYITPELEVVKIANRTQMLAGSPTPDFNDTDATLNGDGDYED